MLLKQAIVKPIMIVLKRDSDSLHKVA